MLESLAQFHQRSIWIFEPCSKANRLEYIFPLITPAFVHEQHLYLGGTSYDWTDRSNRWPVLSGLRFFKNVPYPSEGSISSPQTYPHIITPRPSTMRLVNLMTTSADAQSTVRKIKLDLRIDDRRLKSRRGRRRHYFADIMFDFSKSDRLAVHRELQILSHSTYPQGRLSARRRKFGYCGSQSRDGVGDCWKSLGAGWRARASPP
jgi:hypothetical protein